MHDEDLGVTARLLNADIAVPTIPCEFGLDLSRWCERTSCIVICTLAPLNVTNTTATLMAQVSGPAIQSEKYVHETDEQVLCTPHNRSSIQHWGPTKIDAIRDVLLGSLRFVKALTDFLLCISN